ncbi:trimeric intracellular cation channel type B [Monodelphis domestica]|uniref:Transmembrane protein 38B n=1 Tax=Monodelphis domestica TaxID=13616 RepID=F6YNW4_MONDO|nr:trimeric intracellular cation channel type B [Monodelphis domestica]
MSHLWEDVSLTFSQISMFPFFDIAHYLVSVMSMRGQSGAIALAWNNPFVSWFRAMLYCFGGGILSSLLLGEAPTKFLENSTNVLLASSIWYIVFYCPYDIVYKCYRFLPVQLMATGMREMGRTWKITTGITHASSNYTDAWMVLIAVGWARGAGGSVIINLEQSLRGVIRPESNKLLELSHSAKISLLGAILFTLQHTGDLPVPKHTLMFCFTLFIVVISLIMLLTECGSSPLSPLEAMLSRMLFGSRQQLFPGEPQKKLKSSFSGVKEENSSSASSNVENEIRNKKME